MANRMGPLRTLALSFYYAIHEGLGVSVSGGVLATSDGMTFQGANADWLTSAPVTVYANGVPISGGVVNYPSGTVWFPAGTIPSGTTVTADYTYCFVHVFDDYPDWELEIPQFRFPSISLEIGRVERTPLQLGGNPWEYTIDFFIDVWARNSGERNDITDMLDNILGGSIPWINYNLGFPITASGTLNPAFDAQAQTIALIDRDGWEETPLRKESLGNVERHRMAIHATFLAYADFDFFG